MKPDPYSCPADQITFPVIRDFVRDAIATASQPESLVLEFKAKQNSDNVSGAVAAMSNTSGGIVLVGVDEKQPDPLVGITGREVDGIVQQLRNVLPDALPEVINVAFDSDPSRCILILRVDADAVDPPIVLNGRVLVRIPGGSVGARRDEVIRLSPPRPPVSPIGHGLPIDVATIRMWEQPTNVEVRLHGQFTLPRHASRRSWLGTAAMTAIESALYDSPLPAKVFGENDRRGPVAEAWWTLGEMSALKVSFQSGAVSSPYNGRPSTESMALVDLNGRQLNIVVSTLLTTRPTDTNWRISVTGLREVLLASAITATRAGRAAAEAMGVGAPLHAPRLTAWAGGNPGLAGLRLDINFDSGTWSSDPKTPATRDERRFPEIHPPNDAIADLDLSVRSWLVPLILDHGRTGFEAQLDQLDLPTWARTT